MKSYKSYIFTSLSLVAMIMGGCSDDFNVHDSNEPIIEGKPASISFDVQVGESQKMTRGEMASGKDNEIMTVWLGFFDANTGKLRHKRLLGTDTYVGDHEYNNSIILDGDKDQSNERITSGEYIIAAVANPVGNYGVIYSSTLKVSKRTELDDLLDNVTNFNEYCGVAVMRGDGSTGSISTPQGNLPMQGVYVPDGVTCNFTSNSSAVSDFFAKYSQEKVYIRPNLGTAEILSGKIHFRRMISQNKFNITYDANNIESMEIVQARVFNVPVVSWIAERADDATGNINAGDHPEIFGNSQSTAPNTAPAQVNYLQSARIMSNNIGYNSSTRTYSFDWWQLDNRRVGSDWVDNKGQDIVLDNYHFRETERKGQDGRNTGVYLALDDANTSQISNNNCATFVEIRVRMKVKNLGAEATGLIGNLGAGSQITEAEAVYTVHLGACEGTTDALKAKDFRCRRNTKYTYNVKISGVDQIVVEAVQDEVQSGAEGTVTFVTTQYFESDAHYTAYNIQLSNAERTGAEWQVRVFTSPTAYIDICSSALDGDNSIVYTQHENKYWDWIILRPTSGQNVIADFKPIGSVDTNKPFTLDQLQNVAEYPGYNDSDKNPNNETQRWYTVFVNEYVYRSDDDGVVSDNTSHYAGRYTYNWSEFVNLPDRTFWLKVHEYRSDDHESVVINSKYAIRQKSIQAFADVSNPNIATLGMEHLNETMFTGSIYNHQNGAYGSGEYARARNINYIGNKSWNNFLTKTLNTDQTGVPVMSTGITMGAACLSRNRDLNGDGTIDNNEIRWVLPDKQIYTMMFTAFSALESPLFDFNNPPVEYKDLTPGGSEMAPYHYAMIEGSMFWAEEGCSTGWMGDGTNKNGGYPNQVRCVRYLGTDMAIEADEKGDLGSDPVVSPFIKDEKEDIIRLHLAKEALKDASESSFIRGHKVGNENMKPYKAFEYTYTDYTPNNFVVEWDKKGEDGKPLSLATIWFDYAAEVANNPCKSLNVNGVTGWRLPSIVELSAAFYAVDGNFNRVNVVKGSTLSNTIEIASTERFLVVSGGQIQAEGNWRGYTILCVRDKVD